MARRAIWTLSLRAASHHVKHGFDASTQTEAGSDGGDADPFAGEAVHR
jgi:hypothetical protein